MLDQGRPAHEAADAAVSFCLEGVLSPTALTTAPRSGCRLNCRSGAQSRELQLRERPAQVSDGLADPLLVLDQGEPHVAVSTRSEPDPR